jgi:predicted nucleotidyltransferase
MADILEGLASRLRDESAVVAAVAFGSRVVGGARRDSDLDLGVLFADLDPRQRFLERARLAAAFSDLGVDVVDLDDAPPLLAHRAVRGRRLLVRDPAPARRAPLWSTVRSSIVVWRGSKSC